MWFSFGNFKGEDMISEYEQSEMFQKNYKAFEPSIKEHEKAYIENFKKNRVLPLVSKMANCNLDLYYRLKQAQPNKTDSEFIKNEMNIKTSISKQKYEYQKMIGELKEVGLSFHTSVEMQDEIFDVCKIMLDAAIKYDFPEQAIEMVKMMQDKRIVGEKNCKFSAVEALKGVSKSYIKRYLNESSKDVERVDLKTSIRNLVNSALTGEFGDIKEMTEENLTPKEFATIFKDIFHEAVIKHNKVVGSTKA